MHRLQLHLPSMFCEASMALLVSLALLAILSVGNADVQDVTSIIRLRETDVGDDFVTVDDCYGQALSCSWHRSGWDIQNSVDKCKASLVTGKHLVPAKQLSPWIPVESDHTTVITIEPTSPTHEIQVYLFAEGDDDAMEHASMQILTLSSDGKHQASVCHRGQQTGDEVLIVANSLKVSRKCTSMQDTFLKSKGPPSDPTKANEANIFYQFEYNSGTQQLYIKKGCKSESLIRPGHGSTVYVKYLRLISNDKDVSFTRATLGLVLKDRYGELVSRDVKVTPKASRLCLSVGVTRNVFTTGMKVAVRARDGRQIEFENTDEMRGMVQSRTWRQIHFWNYVADLKQFEDQTVDIHLTAWSHKAGNLFISSINQCKETAGAHQVTVIRQSATLEIHNNEVGDIAPFILPNFGVLGPNSEIVTQCIATMDGCLEWTGFNSTDWTVKSDALKVVSAETPRLQIGLQRNLDVISDDVTPSRQFVDAVEIILHDIHDVGKQNSPRPDYFRAVLLDEYDNLNTSTVYVLSIGISESNAPEAPVLYKCFKSTELIREKVTITQSFERGDCTKLADGQFSSKATEELRLQIAVETTDSGQEVKVSYFPDSTTDVKVKVLSHEDSPPIKITSYMLSSASEDFVYATSYGVGSVFYSLKSPTTEVSSPSFSVPENGKICLALDYFLDGDVGESGFEAKAIGSDGKEVRINSIDPPSKKGEWAHATLTGQINLKTEVSVRVTFKKSDNDLFLLQRISFCHREEGAAIYEGHETIPVSIFHPGARLALTNTPQSVNEAKSCRNGGELQKTGCDCPAGFNGTECETGCGPNRYGGKCQNHCSFSTRGCRGMLMGRPFLGFNCAPGFGGPLCDAQCKEGVTYGAGCLQKCGRCADNTACDSYTGDCPHGCQPGMIPPQCQQEFVYVTSPPYATVTKDSVELEIDLRNRTAGGGARFWQVQYKLKGATEWLDTEKKPIPNHEQPPPTIVRHELKDLAHGTPYLARVILLTMFPGQNYGGDKIPEVAFTTDCEEPKSNEYSLSASALPKGAGIQVSWQYASKVDACQVTSYEVHVKGGWRWNVYRYPAATLEHPAVKITDLLPGHTYRVRVRAITANAQAPFSTIVRATVGGASAPARIHDLHMAVPNNGSWPVAWEAPRFSPISAIKRYDVSYQCIALLACPGLKCPGEEIRKNVNGFAVNLPVNDLLGHARYRLRVLPVGKGEGDADLPGEESSIVFETPAKKTTALAVAILQNPTLNTETSVTVSWGKPEATACADMNGVFVGFRCEITTTPDVALHSVDTLQTFMTFGGLKPATEYKVKVFVKTSAGINEDSSINFNVKTHSPSPRAVDGLVVYAKKSLKDNSALSLRWKPPQWDVNFDYNTDEPVVDIDHYVVEYAAIGSGDNDLQSQGVPAKTRCPAWPEEICHQIIKLAKDTQYSITVHAVSVDGKAGPRVKVVAATSQEGAPGKPSQLRQESSTSDSITLSVGIPDVLNGVLRRFLIVAECDEEELPVEDHFDVHEELTSYSHTLTGLTPGSKYRIKVMAMTKPMRFSEAAILDMRKAE